MQFTSCLVRELIILPNHTGLTRTESRQATKDFKEQEDGVVFGVGRAGSGQ